MSEIREGTKIDSLTRYTVLAIDSLDRVTIVSGLFVQKKRMTAEYNKKKAAGESHLLRARVSVQVEEIYEK